MIALSRKNDRRRGFTLVELMVAIAIIAILAGLLLGVAATAGQASRTSKTKSMIGRLHSLLMDRYDLYRTRRVDLGANWRTQAMVIENSGINYGGLDPRLREAAGRLMALREQMKIEMPDRWSDVVGGSVPTNPVQILTIRGTLFLETSPSLYANYARAYNKICPDHTPPHINTLTGVVNTRDEILANQGAECLYLIIMNATGDGEVRSLFRETDVGDTDGDGAPEFLDGWGQPISFIRWAPGFDSDAQLSDEDWRDASVGGNDVRNDIAEDHDPYDLFRVDVPSETDSQLQAADNYVGLRGWRLLPLIVSPGADAELGLRIDDTFVQRANPYATIGTGVWLGSADDPDAISDNVHNHSIATISQSR